MGLEKSKNFDLSQYFTISSNAKATLQYDKSIRLMSDTIRSTQNYLA
jgi:hypothetical protein